MEKLLFVLAAILLAACNTQPNSTSASKDDPGVIVRTDTVYLLRNADITPANAYSDLFLDSLAVENFIQSQALPPGEAKYFRSFYNYRNGQFAWFTTQGFTEQAKGFWNLQDQLGSNAEKALRNKMDTLLNNDTLNINRFDTAIAQVELALTKNYLQFYSANKSKTLLSELSAETAIPVKKESVATLADSILQRNTDTASAKMNSNYYALKKQLEAYRSVSKQGGWIVIPSTAKQLKKGTSSPMVTLVKKRLLQSGQLAGADTSRLFDSSLVVALTNYQFRNGMKPNGMITDSLIRSLNIPVEERMKQIIINLNRMMWMPAEKATNYIVVNIPEFILSVYENNTRVFDMPVAVGKEGTHTMMFSGKLDQVVFSPYWNIPASIVQREILPNMRANPNYLQSKRMEIVGKNDSLPVVRQLPGKDNAMGRVKFLFPNRFDIYFHDTYAKEVFTRSNRAISHGCIRVADAEKLANYLLRGNNAWNPEKIAAAMNSGKEQTARPTPMPVIISYYTAWVDESDQINFRDDIYANDNKVSQVLFTNTVVPIASIPAKDSARERGVKTDTSLKRNAKK